MAERGTLNLNLHDADETEVEVEYSITYDGNGWDEPRTCEVEIESVTWEGEEVAVLDAEYNAFCDRIAESHEPDDGSDQAYDDYRDRD